MLVLWSWVNNSRNPAQAYRTHPLGHAREGSVSARSSPEMRDCWCRAMTIFGGSRSAAELIAGPLGVRSIAVRERHRRPFRSCTFHRCLAARPQPYCKVERMLTCCLSLVWSLSNVLNSIRRIRVRRADTRTAQERHAYPGSTTTGPRSGIPPEPSG
jgi:hypothetical protein